MQWHSWIVAAFLVGVTIYVVSNFNDNAGWVYVLMLLLGISLLYKDFSLNLFKLGPGNTGPPTSGLVP